MKTPAYYGLLILAFIAGMGVFWFINIFREDKTIVEPLRMGDLNTNEYKYINPLLAINDITDETPREYVDLRQSINSFIQSKINSGDIDIASVYVRDVSLAKGFDINKDEQYSPASLLKVPTMIAYFRLAEIDPSVLSRKISYVQKTDYNVQEHIKSPVHIESGKTYTIEELIEYMIKYSDNNAATLLVEHFNDSGSYAYLNNVFNDLGVHTVSLDSDFITVKTYSLFFRVLYNATYLGKNMSEKALGILTQTDFKGGISAGVPESITVAQKFGEFTMQSPSGNIEKRELSNCGIVYYPDHPYLLCVMTKGDSFDSLQKVIAGISGQVFNYYKKQYPTK